MVPQFNPGPVPANQPLRPAARGGCLGFCVRPDDGPLFGYLWDKYFPGWDLEGIGYLFADGDGLSVIGGYDDDIVYTLPWVAAVVEPADV